MTSRDAIALWMRSVVWPGTLAQSTRRDWNWLLFQLTGTMYVGAEP